MAAVAEAEKLRQQGIDVVDCTAGEPHFSTPQHIKDAAIAAINGNFTQAIRRSAGTLELKDAILRRHSEDFGSGYKRDEVYRLRRWQTCLVQCNLCVGGSWR